MTIKLAFASVLALSLAACGQSKDAAPEEAAAPPAETTTADTETASAEGLCEGFGPQTPRDITSASGTNGVEFAMAPEYTSLNLCNIHTHTNAEHKGPGYSVYVGPAPNGGYACDMASELTEDELAMPEGGMTYGDAKPGDTIEVHWVFSSCDVQPGEGLGSCLSEGCTDPLLRVEAQVFLLVNDPTALNFMDYVETVSAEGRPQPMAIPADTGTPVVFRGSTTGPSYTQSTCSPLQVTWSVRPQCVKLDVNSLNAWAESGNVFNETKSHGVRDLVTAPELLSPISPN